MKLWIKIVLGGQVLLILFFFVLAQIQKKEAEKQTVMALMETGNALKAREEAEKQAEMAERHIAMARAAQAEAELQRALAQEAEAELAKCSGKK